MDGPHADREAALRQHWQALCGQLGLNDPAARPLGERLLRAWRRWPRRYHDTRHLAACIDAAAAVRAHCVAPSAVAWALWFHDAVYWPWARDNEARSADWARDSALALGLPTPFATQVHRLVMATAHGQGHATDDPDAPWVLDIDLGVLGQPAEVYDRYARDVRREYFWVLPATWRRGRAAVLRNFLNQPAIYRTPLFQQQLEAQARANLQRELAALS
jgi:predicted metal-dependent HD superfamily phosphohydrolase